MGLKYQNVAQTELLERAACLDGTTGGRQILLRNYAGTMDHQVTKFKKTYKVVVDPCVGLIVSIAAL